VRAFAANSVGAGYGNEVVFTTQTPAPDVMKIVSKDGSGNYTTVQAAFDSVPDNYTGKYVIYIRKGTYKEKLLLGANKTNVILAGEDRDSTILTYDDYAGKPGLGTSTSYSVAIDASDFVAMNITFQNTVMNDGSVANQQAVALRVNGDRQAYYNCKLLGYQDTYYTWGGSNAGRTYHKNCTITGSVDFIFGRNIVVFDSCTIHENRNGGTLTAASTDATTKFGYVFLNSTITYDAIGFDGNPVTNFYLGRPWQASPRTVFIQCSEPSTLNAAGWLAWNVLPALYGEYKCSGAGYIPASRDATLSRAISDSEAATYTLANIFSKNSVSPSFGFDWVPTMPVVSVPTSVAIGSAIETPAQFTLSQNYPNPFNPTTAIEFTVRNNGRATLRVYNIVGQPVAELFNGEAEAGKLYLEKFDASRFASGIYFSVLQMGSRRLVHKMSLLK
jgi:pectinesterase